jgi:intein/homing endonuclease
MNRLSISSGIFDHEDFWWLVGYLHGDGTFDRKNGVWFVSKDYELIESAKEAVTRLFGLPSRVYIEQSKPPGEPKLRLAVFSRGLNCWLIESGFKFGRIQWKVPVIPRGLFSAYLAGLFDAEGHIELYRNKTIGVKIRRLIIYSINSRSLLQISRILRQHGVESTLVERIRADKPNLHFELRIYGRSNLEWFAENVGAHCRLTRKKKFLNDKFLPRGNSNSA